MEKNDSEGWLTPNGKGCLTVIVLLFILFIFNLFSSKKDNSSVPSPQVSTEDREWAGVVLKVKTWLNANLKDPGSLEFIDFSPLAKTEVGTTMIRVKYRAKNSFGGYEVENKVFLLNPRSL